MKKPELRWASSFLGIRQFKAIAFALPDDTDTVGDFPRSGVVDRQCVRPDDIGAGEVKAVDELGDAFDRGRRSDEAGVGCGHVFPPDFQFAMP